MSTANVSLPAPFAPPIPETVDDYEPTAEDREWIAACNLDYFLPHSLAFTAWLDQQARQHALRDDKPWHEWLAKKIAELSQLATWTGSSDPQTLDERLSAYEELVRQDRYDAGFKDGRLQEGGV